MSNKKNILFIVVDSVTNDIIFNKENSQHIVPFLSELRKKSITGDKMYSEAPYTEAALEALLASLDTMDKGGYMEKLKDKKTILDILTDNGYKTFYNSYCPLVCPHAAGKSSEKRYIEVYNFFPLWDYRLEYYRSLYLEHKTTNKENKMLEEIMEDNFLEWTSYLEKLKNKDVELNMLIDAIDISDLDNTINEVTEEFNKFKNSKRTYLEELFTLGLEHKLFKIKVFKMTDKIHDDEARKEIITKFKPILKKIAKLDFKYNLRNNHFPYKKLFKYLSHLDFKNVKGLLAGYKNSLFDKDLYTRFNYHFDLFKAQRSFRRVSQEFFEWLDNNKEEPWMSYIHIDDAHFNDSYFTYDTADLDIIDSEIKQIKKYLNTIDKNYKGSITYDLSLLYCDSIIKNIYNYLMQKDILKDTYIIITADHGFSYYFSPIREKYVISSYKENYNVPFIVSGPDIKPRKIDKFLTTKDIPATIIDLASLESVSDFKGKSLLKTKGQDYATIEFMGGGCPDILRRPIYLGVRTDNYLVVIDVYLKQTFDTKIIKEIYDLKNDPFEHNNLKDKPHIEEKIKRELNLLEKRYNEIKREYKNMINDKE